MRARTRTAQLEVLVSDPAPGCGAQGRRLSPDPNARVGENPRSHAKRASAVFLASVARTSGSARLSATRRGKEAAVTGIAVLFAADSARAVHAEKYSLTAP